MILQQRYAASSDFRADIQGLRALAVLAVVLYHAGLPFVPGGYVGVDVFFVISGFLITSHLLAGFRRDGRMSFPSFYAKRARRILPASLFVVVGTIVAALLWYPPLLFREVWAGAVATALYVPNYLFAAQGTNYLSESTPSLFQHFWSLGIEEQFYLFWPLLLAAGFFFIKRPRWLFVAVSVIVVVSFAACVVLTFRSQPWAFFGLPTRAWELGVGGLVAFIVSYRPRWISGVTSAAIGWVGLAGIVASTTLFASSTPFPGFWAVVPVLATAAVIVAGDGGSRFGPSALLSIRPLMFIGAISYSLYLVHWPILMIPKGALGFEQTLPLWITVGLAAISVPTAWLLYKYIENPGRRTPWLANARPRRSLIVAGVGSLIVALFASGALALSNSRELSTSASVPPVEVHKNPVPTSFVPDNLTPSLRTVSDDIPQTYGDGCHLNFAATGANDACVYGDDTKPKIVLFGDSHAAQWFPALMDFATTHGYSLESRTKSSCPSLSARILRAGVPYEECKTWRETVIERINDAPPALVVIANFGYVTFADDGEYSTLWGEALGDTIDRIKAPTVVVADTPNLGSTPSVCLSAHLDDAVECSVARDTALASPARDAEASAAANRGVPLLDFTDYLCTDVCGPILGNVLVYRDAHHLTATMSQAMSEAMRVELTRVLPSNRG